MFQLRRTFTPLEPLANINICFFYLRYKIWPQKTLFSKIFLIFDEPNFLPIVRCTIPYVLSADLKRNSAKPFANSSLSKRKPSRDATVEIPSCFIATSKSTFLISSFSTVRSASDALLTKAERLPSQPNTEHEHGANKCQKCCCDEDLLTESQCVTSKYHHHNQYYKHDSLGSIFGTSLGCKGSNCFISLTRTKLNGLIGKHFIETREH